MTPGDFHAYATRLAIEAGANPERARERMAQVAQTYASDVEVAAMHARGCSCRETDEERAVDIAALGGR